MTGVYFREDKMVIYFSERDVQEDAMFTDRYSILNALNVLKDKLLQGVSGVLRLGENIGMAVSLSFSSSFPELWIVYEVNENSILFLWSDSYVKLYLGKSNSDFDRDAEHYIGTLDGFIKEYS
jgi:hypothetical protein